MLTTCIACHAPLPRNDRLEHLRAGRRVVFDPDRGRLWAVCPHCQRWTLAPIEARWEAIEELERLARDRARVLYATEHVGLLSVPGLEMVRVGRAPRREEAWWRYSRELLARRKASDGIVTRGRWLHSLLHLVLVGLPIGFFLDRDYFIERARLKRFGTVAWEGEIPCVRCGDPLRNVLFKEWPELALRAAGDGIALANACYRCQREGREGGEYLITGAPAEHVLRRMLAFQNFGGATDDLVERAANVASAAPSPRAMAERAGAGGLALRYLYGEDRLALEMTANDTFEREVLALSAAELEARWREEETIAAIADNELTLLRGPKP